MKRGTVYYRDIPAGTLEKDASGYVFRYDAAYLRDATLPDISSTLPKSACEYRSTYLFPFFAGLLAEGAQKERQCRELHIDERDLFTRLLETSAYGAIGAIYVTRECDLSPLRRVATISSNLSQVTRPHDSSTTFPPTRR